MSNNIDEIKEAVRELIKNYEKAPGEMWIPDFIDKDIEKLKELTGYEQQSSLS